MLEFNYKDNGQAYTTPKKQFTICGNGLLQSVLIYPGVIKGEK